MRDVRKDRTRVVDVPRKSHDDIWREICEKVREQEDKNKREEPHAKR